MDKRLESLYEGEHWFNKYLSVDKKRPIRKPPLYRRVSIRKKTKVETIPVIVAEALLQLSEQTPFSFLLRPCRGGNVPQLETPNITSHTQTTTISQLKDYLMVRVANYDYQIGLQDPISDSTSFTPLYNSVKLGEISPSAPSQELILFYQLESSSSSN